MKKPLAILGAFIVLAASQFAYSQDISKARDITTNDGKIYAKAKITRITPSGLEISYAKGATFIRFENLNETIQKEFHFDAETAQSYRNQQQELAEQQKKAEEQRKLKEGQDRSEMQEKAKVESEAKAARYAETRRSCILNGNLYVITKDITTIDGRVMPVGALGFHPGDDFLGNGKEIVYKGKIYQIDSSGLNLLCNVMNNEQAILSKDMNTIPNIERAIDGDNAELKDARDKICAILSSVGGTSYTNFSFNSSMSFNSMAGGMGWGNGFGSGTAITTNAPSPAQMAMLNSLYSRGCFLTTEIRRLQQQHDAIVDESGNIQKRLTFYSSEIAMFERERAIALAERKEAELKTQPVEEPKPTQDDAPLKKRLAALKTLLDDGTLTRDEYDKKVDARKNVLDMEDRETEG